MASKEIDFDELFRRISSPQTSERFKALRLATSEDLASTFKPSPADSGKMEAQLNFPFAPHLMPTRGKKSDME